MDDLISRAEAIERMKSMAGCATCDNYNYVRCRACIWDDAMNIVEEMSEVEAVPVDWLDEQIHGYASRLQSTELKALLIVKGLWEKEQEAR